MFNKIISSLYGSGIGKYPIFKQIYYIHDFFVRKFNKNDIIKSINIGAIKFDIRFNLRDGYVSKELFVKSIYESEITDIFLKELKEGDVVFDIGANIGYFSLLASKLVGTKGKILAFEPVEYNYRQLEENVKLNNISNIELCKYGLGNSNKEIIINIDPNNIGHNSIVNDFGSGIKKTIRIKKIDDIIKNIKNINLSKVKIIKIDVEGFEFDVLKGMNNFLVNYNGIIVMEFTPSIYNKQTQDIIDFIYGKGFDVYIINPNGKINKIDLNDFKNIEQINILLKKSK